MTGSRLHLPGSTHTSRSILIRFVTAQDVVDGFGQMPGHRADGLGVALAGFQPSIQPADVPLGTTEEIGRAHV